MLRLLCILFSIKYGNNDRVHLFFFTALQGSDYDNYFSNVPIPIFIRRNHAKILVSHVRFAF
jgi:hypothetical protein